MTGISRDPLTGKLPVTLITGYLGSGKTTLIRSLLRDPAMSRAAVIVNEFGEVGIDHELVQSSTEATAISSNGCLCCAIRSDLQETLRELFLKRRSGEVIDFERVFVETSGLADPVPVLHTLRTDGLLGAQYRLDAVLTVVDAVNGMRQLDTAPEAPRQVAVADRIVITKPDLAGDEAVSALERRLLAMNPYAERAVALNGRLDASFVRDVSPSSVRASLRELDRWMGLSPTQPATQAGHGRYLGGRAGKALHDPAVGSFCLWFEQPFSWSTFSSAVELLTSLRGSDLLRVKGLVNVAGERGPVVVQGAQHLFHPPVTLDSWPGADHRSRVVFITRNIARVAVEKLFSAVAAVASSE